MGIVRKKSNAYSLTNELVAARFRYNSVRDSVLDRAVDRQDTVRETIGDLEVEHTYLQAVIDEARNPQEGP